MIVVDREVVGESLALGDSERLRAREVDHASHPRGFGSKQHVPGAEHVHGHDLLGAAGRVVSERPKMHDRAGSRRRALDGSQVEQIRTVGEIKPGDRVTAPVKMLGDGNTDLAPMPSDENSHG